MILISFGITVTEYLCIVLYCFNE